MTLEEVKASTEIFLTATDVAPIIGCKPQAIRLAARQKPELLGFPTTVVGTRTRIPRKQFLEYLREE